MGSVPLVVLCEAVLLAGMGVALGYLSWHVYRKRSAPGAVWFSGVLALLSAGLVLAVAVGLVTGFDGSDLWLTTLYAVVLLTPIPWIGFVARFTGRGDVLTRRRLIVLSAPLIVGTMMVFSPLVTGSAGAVFLFGIIVVFFYAVMLVFVGGALLIRTTYLYSHLSISQGIAPAIALIEPWFVLTVVFQPIDLSLPVRMGFVAAGMGLVTVLLVASVRRLDLLETAAAAGNVGGEAVIEEIDEIVFVTDDDHRVVRLNGAAMTTLGLERSEVLGKPLVSIIDATPESLGAKRTIELYTSEGYRLFETGVSPLSDQHDRAFGHVITLSDVTRREIRQGQLRVLNRVLRHNLRNKMDVVHALASTVEAPPDVSQQIKQAADDLLAISERAREIEQSTGALSISQAPVDIPKLIASIADAKHDQYPDVSITTNTPAELTIQSDPSVLENVLSNLIDNAAQYNDADRPRVSVAAGHADVDGERRMIDIEITDNGPGISDHERAVIEEGDETPLQHGAGLGLWTARWGTRILGGHLAFEDNDPRGTIVRVRIPARTEAADGDNPGDH